PAILLPSKGANMSMPTPPPGAPGVQYARDSLGNPIGLTSPNGTYGGLTLPPGINGKNVIAGNLGTKITDIATGTITITSGAAKVNSPLIGGLSMKLSVGANYDLTNVNYVTSASQAITLGFWAYKPKNSPRSVVSIFASKAANYTNYISASVLIEPGLNFYCVPMNNGVVVGTGI